MTNTNNSGRVTIDGETFFYVYCDECGESIGVTSCEITATSMHLCRPCEDRD